ncbi:ABC transporter permease [gut metagenome]|uniref:ABC transporter permease n=1 Tax=gut metagenome TaxID=749906 RepID=J9H5S2_9ZZZZ
MDTPILNPYILHRMDRPIVKEVLRKRRLKLVGTVAEVTLTAVATVVLTANRLQTHVKASSLTFYQVDVGTIEAGVSAYGKVVPAFEEIINSPIDSRIVEVYAQSGDTVEAGMPLVKLDLQSVQTNFKKLQDEEQMKLCRMEQQTVNDETYLSDLEMQINIARMKLDRMKVEWRNESYLDSLGSGTADQVRQAELVYQTAKMELKQLTTKLRNERKVRQADHKVKQLELAMFYKSMAEQKRTLDNARICAPRRAVLTFIHSLVGAQVGKGEKLAILADVNRYKIEGELADTYADRVRIGANVLVRVNHQVSVGKVSGVAPKSKNGVVGFYVQLADSLSTRLRSGIKADLYVVHALREQAVRIANRSFYTGSGEYTFFVRKDDELHQRTVRLGECDFDHVEVISGLQPDEEIVTSDMSSYKQKRVVKLE